LFTAYLFNNRPTNIDNNETLLKHKVDSLQKQIDSLHIINKAKEQNYLMLVDSFNNKSSKTITIIKNKYNENIKYINSLSSDEQFKLFTKNLSSKNSIR